MPKYDYENMTDEEIVSLAQQDGEDWYEYAHEEELLPDGSWAGSALCLVRNFLDCVKSREEPTCPLEVGHRSTSFALLANIALKMKSRLEWDPVNERFTNCEKANELLHYDYREGYRLG